ncbi:hydrogen peroxide-inducible genes activator [Falsiruegeria mediterranea]
MSNITLRQIRYFAVLSSTLQYRRAAQQLGISQPSLSLQIAALEEALGARLIERKRSGLILTPTGREAAAQAERVLREVDGLVHVAGPSRSEMSGTLRLGSSPTIGPYLLPRVLRQLHQSYPDLKLVIRDSTPKELVEDLIAGRHDMILTQLPVPGDNLRLRTLFREPLSLAVAREHPLAERKQAVRADLSGESLLSLSPAFALHTQVTGLGVDTGATLRNDFEGTSLDALRQMVSLGMGVTLLPALYVRSEVNLRDPDVSVLDLRPPLYRQIGLAWRAASGEPPAFARFADLIRDVVRTEFAAEVTLTS